MSFRLNLVLLIGFLSGCARSNCVGIKWVNFNQFNNKSQPFIGGLEVDHKLYHCRVIKNGKIEVGKAIVELDSCYIPVGTSEEIHSNFQILTNPDGANLQYVNASDKSIPVGSLIAGRSSRGNLIYMSRGSIDSNQALGKVEKEFAYIPYRGSATCVNHYEMLTCSSRNGLPNEHELRIVNNCNVSIQIGIRGEDFTPENGGFYLNVGERKILWVPLGWTCGRIWAKTNCGLNNCCEFGGCGGCNMSCGGPPTTDVSLAEFNMDKLDDQDYYGVSFVDALNLNISIKPIPGTFQTSRFGNRKYDCRVASTFDDIIDCDSAYKKYKRGLMKSKNSSSKSDDHIKTVSQLVNNYSFDNKKEKFKCRGAPNKLTGYVITFCP